MSRSLVERGVCLVLKGGGVSEGFLDACMREALRLIHAQEAQFDVSGEHAVVRIVNRERYQALGGFCGVLVEVHVESDARDASLSMLVNPRFAGPVFVTWVDVVLDGNTWRLEDEDPMWN